MSGFIPESTHPMRSRKREKSNELIREKKKKNRKLHGTIACQTLGSAGHVTVSISTHAAPSSYTSCGQQHNNKATSPQISYASSEAMISSRCERSAHPLLSVTAQVASASLFKNCLYRFRYTRTFHPRVTF